jgi:hypothetical protein
MHPMTLLQLLGLPHRLLRRSYLTKSEPSSAFERWPGILQTLRSSVHSCLQCQLPACQLLRSHASGLQAALELCVLPGVLPMVYELDRQGTPGHTPELRPAHRDSDCEHVTSASGTAAWESAASLHSVVETLVVNGGGDGGGASASVDEERHVGLRLLEAAAARLNTAAQLQRWHPRVRAAMGGAGVGSAREHYGGVATDMNTAARHRLLARLDGRSIAVPSAVAELERQWEPPPIVTSGDAG